MTWTLSSVVNQDRCPLDSTDFRIDCKKALDRHGVLAIPDFLYPAAIDAICAEGKNSQRLAYYTENRHNIYLEPPDPDYPNEHPRNREVSSSKGCITTDQIPPDSALAALYDAPEFRRFLCAVLGEAELYEYADPLSSINLHYASAGQELGWHFDNSSFAITLLVAAPKHGGEFQYVKNVRDADRGEMNFDRAGAVLDGRVTAETLRLTSGTLVLFRGRNSMHRVTPVEGEHTRMLAVLAFNTRPGVALSESARMTFFGRLE